ncbi:SDR family oxidoreductase [Arthrobacter sp. KK5.5]|uniref:SDR family oxidoreductase n=1 Tax=Arthrobacter sp. KK5.5 TaxID=3373084 RepID=UPI003EE59596
MNILIAGCGDLGTEAGLRFAAAGHHVTGWRRNPSRLPQPIAGVAADLTGELPPIPAGTDVVVYTPAAGERSADAYRRTYVHGLANVLDALGRDGVTPRRFLFVSSTTVYGDAAGAMVDEDTPANPASATGGLMREAERTLHGRRPDGIVLRLSGIYGPGRTRLIDTLRAGTAVVPSGSHPTNRIHRDDAAAAIVHLTTSVAEPAPLYVGVDDDPAELGDVLRFLAAELGLPEPRVGETTTTRGGNRRLSNARLRSTGFDLAYPTFRQGYRAMLEDKAAPRH